jgi:hypothetical protein
MNKTVREVIMKRKTHLIFIIFVLPLLLSALLALIPSIAAEKWRFEAADEIKSSPTVVGGVVHFTDMAGYVYALR